MTHIPAHPTNQTDAALDAALDAHFNWPAQQLAPSSGFVLSVMDAIEQQAVVPPPIPFPWRRVLPGAIAILCIFIAFAVYLFSAHAAGPADQENLMPFSSRLTFAVFTPTELTLGWIGLAVCLSITATAASFRLTNRTR
jgi:hypothetical protein